MQNRDKLGVLAEAFDLLGHRPQFRSQAETIRKRLGERRR
jgi:hypothetical protein